MAEEYVCAVGVEPGENAKVEDGLCNLSPGFSDDTCGRLLECCVPDT